MPEQRNVAGKGGTMRLGAYPCHITNRDTLAFRAYGAEDISSATATAMSSTTTSAPC